MEPPVSLHQFRANCRIIKAGQSAGGDGIEKLLVEQLLAKRPQVRGAVVNQRLQRGLANVEVSVSVERDFLDRLQRATVAKERAKVARAVAKGGVTCVPLSLYFKGSRAKAEIALVKGKKQHDKRAAIKEREWNREQQRLLRQ
jgi:hypothetical protein